MKSGATAWRAAYAVCAIAAVVPLLVTYRLPMADLAQHSVQATVWKFLSDPCYRFDQTYEVNRATPYLLAALDQLVMPRKRYVDRGMVQRWLSGALVRPGSTCVIFRNGSSWKFGGKQA